MSAETSRAERVAGVDGCRNGWVVASLAADGALHPRVEMVESFGAVLDLGFAAVGVDMPFQLLEDGPRPDETEARRLLGPRRSSIFPSPIRAVLDCIDYAEALEVSRRLSGRGLSKQAWNLVPKIIEVRDAVFGSPEKHVLEVSPELSFLAIIGAPMPEPKRTADGQQARIDALASVLGELPAEVGDPPKPAKVDDVFDALAVAWSVRRWVHGEAISVGRNPTFVY